MESRSVDLKAVYRLSFDQSLAHSSVGGIFGALADQIQATEFTNWDAYSLNIFNGNYTRPQQCVNADPDSQFCQLLGKYLKVVSL